MYGFSWEIWIDGSVITESEKYGGFSISVVPKKGCKERLVLDFLCCLLLVNLTCEE
jgi:hypothetical protein